MKFNIHEVLFVLTFVVSLFTFGLVLVLLTREPVVISECARPLPTVKPSNVENILPELEEATGEGEMSLPLDVNEE